MFTLPRMVLCLVLTLALMALSLALQAYQAGTLVAVTAYKAHLMALGGWGGYWLDRALFPYARPDTFMGAAATDRTVAVFNASQLRRAIVVAACLICVGLGA